MLEPHPYCSTCFKLFKMASSCPRSYIFEEGNWLDIALEIIWLLGSLQPFIILIALFCYLLYHRTSRLLFLLLNNYLTQLICSTILKRIVAEIRPLGACSLSFGFPSGHSASAGGWATWLILEWVVFHDKVPFKKWRFYAILRDLALITMPLTPISRYFLNYHTWKQIVFGLFLGFLCGLGFFCLMVALIYRNEGKFWNDKVVKLMKFLRGEENILTYRSVSHYLTLDHEKGSEKETELLIILPIRESIEWFLWRKKSKKEEYISVIPGENEENTKLLLD